MDLDNEPTDAPDVGSTPATPRPVTTRSARTWIGAGLGAAARGPGAAGMPNGGGPGGRGGGMPGAFGTIASISGDTITVTDPMRGSTTTVHTSSSTVVHTSPTTTGALSDLKVGDRVHVDGTTAGDGSLTATAIDSGVGGPGMSGGQPPQGQGQMGNGPQGPMGQPPQGQL